MTEEGRDASVVTPFGWTITMRELGNDKLLLTWGDKHALVLDMREKASDRVSLRERLLLHGGPTFRGREIGR